MRPDLHPTYSMGSSWEAFPRMRSIALKTHWALPGDTFRPGHQQFSKNAPCELSRRQVLHWAQTCTKIVPLELPEDIFRHGPRNAQTLLHGSLLGDIFHSPPQKCTKIVPWAFLGHIFHSGRAQRPSLPFRRENNLATRAFYFAADGNGKRRGRRQGTGAGLGTGTLNKDRTPKGQNKEPGRRKRTQATGTPTQNWGNGREGTGRTGTGT